MYKRKYVTIQFVQNGILILNKNEIKEYKLSSVNNYKVINKDKFIKELQNILDKLKINKNILTNNIKIIIDNTYTSLDIENIELIFKELSFNKITYINKNDILNIKEHELIIDISKEILKIHFLKETIEQKIYFNKYSEYLYLLLKSIIRKYSIKSIKIYGNNCNTNIIKDIELISMLDVYIYSHPSTIPISLLT